MQTWYPFSFLSRRFSSFTSHLNSFPVNFIVSNCFKFKFLCSFNIPFLIYQEDNGLKKLIRVFSKQNIKTITKILFTYFVFFFNLLTTQLLLIWKFQLGLLQLHCYILWGKRQRTKVFKGRDRLCMIVELKVQYCREQLKDLFCYQRNIFTMYKQGINNCYGKLKRGKTWLKGSDLRIDMKKIDS